MQSARLVAPSKVSIDNLPVPDPAPGEVLIRVSWGGICGSDISLYKGKIAAPYPITLGHEISGVVVKSGRAANSVKPGDAVIIQPNYSCLQCRPCRGGQLNICAEKKKVGINYEGAFSEFVAAPVEFTRVLPPGLPLRDAVFLEPLSASLRAVDMFGTLLGKKVFLSGLGPMGILALQLLRLKGARVCAVDLVPQKLKMAESLGASWVAHAGDEETLHSLAKDGLFDATLDCTGAADAIAMGIRYLAAGGQQVVLGLPNEAVQTDYDRIVRNELSVQGSIVYVDEFRRAMPLLESGMINTSSLVTGEFPLEKTGEALAAVVNDFHIKVLIKFPSREE